MSNQSGRQRQDNAPQPDKEKDAIISITEHAHSLMEKIHTSYKWIGLTVAALVAICIWFTNHSASEWVRSIREDAQRAQEAAKGDAEAFKRQQQQAVMETVKQVRSEIESRVAQEFDSKNISLLVSNAANERIDVIADKLIKTAIAAQAATIRSNVNETLASYERSLLKRLSDADDKLGSAQKLEKEMQETVAEAQKALMRLEAQSEFVVTTLAAQNDDRGAFEKLVRWSAEPDYAMRNLANMAVSRIAENNHPDSPLAIAQVSWAKGARPETYDLDRVLTNWDAVPGDQGWAYIEFVRSHTNLVHRQKMDFYHSVVTNSHNSLRAANHAAAILASEIKFEYNSVFHLKEAASAWEVWAKTNALSSPTNSTK